MKCRLLVCCLLLPFFCSAVQSYTPTIADPILEPWRWRHEEFLSGKGVLALGEAADGTLWLLNREGLLSYDGITLKTVPFDGAFDFEVDSGLSESHGLLVLPTGNVVVLVGTRLLLWNDEVWSVLISDVGRAGASARLSRGEDGSIWLMVADGVWKISKDGSESSRVLLVNEDEWLSSFCLEKPGTAWAVVQKSGSKARLVQFAVTGSTLDRTGLEGSIPFNGRISKSYIMAADNGLIWYADQDSQSGFSGFDPVSREWSLEAESSRLRRCYSLIERADGSVFGGAEGELLYLSPDGKRHIYLKEWLPLPNVAAHVFDGPHERLWVLSGNGEVYSVDTGDSEWLTYEQLNYQCESSGGLQWFCAANRQKVVTFEPLSGEWTMYGLEDGLIDGCLNLFESSHGLLWATGSHQGRAALAVFNGSRWERRLHPGFAEWIEPNAVLEADDGTMWFGAGGRMDAGQGPAGGALQYEVSEQGKVSLLKHHSAPQFPLYVTSLEQGDDGDIWIGSTQVYRYKKASQTVEMLKPLDGDNTVGMIQNQDGLWVAKENLGICQWDGESWDVHTTERGLAGLILSNMLQLNDGSLLVASDRGISRYDGSSWTTHLYPEELGMIRRLSKMSQSSDGSVWLSYDLNENRSLQMMHSEVRVFRAVRHRPETRSPDTRIIDCPPRVSPPGNSHVTWEGHDPWSRTPSEDLQYSWRLNEGEWSPFSEETSHTFLELDSGEYTLDIRARDLAFNIDPTPSRVEFEVLPPVWRQTWFVSLISSLVGLIIFFLWRWIQVREQRLFEQQEQRKAFLIRQQQEQEAALRGELATLHQSFQELELKLKETRAPFIEFEEKDDDSDREFLTRIMDVLEERYSDWEFRREDLAESFNMSLSSFQRKLSAVSKQTPKGLIREFRLSRAAELLAHTSLTVTDIAFKTGHDDSGSFGRMFKKHFNMTPTDYRMKHASS